MFSQLENIEEIQKNLDFCVWSIDNAYCQYAEYLKKYNYTFITREIKNEIYYFAVHHSYREEFRWRESHLIPDWAIKQIPRDVFLKG